MDLVIHASINLLWLDLMKFGLILAMDTLACMKQYLLSNYVVPSQFACIYELTKYKIDIDISVAVNCNHIPYCHICWGDHINRHQIYYIKGIQPNKCSVFLSGWIFYDGDFEISHLERISFKVISMLELLTKVTQMLIHPRHVTSEYIMRWITGYCMFYQMHVLLISPISVTTKHSNMAKLILLWKTREHNTIYGLIVPNDRTYTCEQMPC